MNREEAELREYLGAAFDHTRLVRWQEQLEEEAAQVGDEARLYRTSQAYLYNLTAFAMTGTKAPYLAAVKAVVPPPARVLDVGCGIGSDGLALLDAGYRVEFAEYDNPSAAYLRWRLERRGLDTPIHDLDAAPLPTGFDVAYAFDVLEHADDWRALLASMERAARIVCVNALETSPDETVLHRELPVGDVVAHAARRRLLRYQRHHDGRSHLLLYDARPATGPARVLSAWRAARGARPRRRSRPARPSSAAAGGAPRGG
jgi:SAM-dependent methyltransferase